MSHCPNCGNEITEKASYCYNCGQQQDKDVLSFKGFLSHALDALVHYDSSLWRTLKYIFVPGKITRDFLNGKRKSYLNPVRFFIILAIVFFFISSPGISFFGTGEDTAVSKRRIQYQNATSNEVIDFLDLDQRNYFPNDSIRRLYQSFVKMGMVDSVNTSDPSFSGWELDSLSVNIYLPVLTDSSVNITIDYRDLVFLSTDSITQKYNIKGGIRSYVASQVIRITTSFDSYGEYVASKLSWLFFILIPLQALFMMVFYWRRNYIEHVIFLLHLHSLAFIVLIILGLISPLLPEFITYSESPVFYIFISVAGLAVYYFIAARKVYEDSPLITALKMIPLFFIYCIDFLVSFAIVVLLSLLIF